MALKLHFLINPLWSAHVLLQLAIAVVMFRRKLHRKFPVFFSYIVFETAATPIVFFLYSRSDASTGYYAAYFYSYWLVGLISQVLGFQIIYELFLNVFQPYHTLKDLGAVLFKWAALVMLLVAGVIATSAGPEVPDVMVQTILTLQRCVRMMQSGLIFFLILFSKYLRISYKQHSFGIAAGFGLSAAVELFIAAWVAGGHGKQAVGLISVIGYNCAVLVWLAYVLLKKQPKEAPENLLVPQRWDQSLMDLQHPLPADSLIPMFENMVEQAISRASEEQAGLSLIDSLTLDSQPVAEKSSANSDMASSATASGGSTKR